MLILGLSFALHMRESSKTDTISDAKRTASTVSEFPSASKQLTIQNTSSRITQIQQDTQPRGWSPDGQHLDEADTNLILPLETLEAVSQPLVSAAQNDTTREEESALHSIPTTRVHNHQLPPPESAIKHIHETRSHHSKTNAKDAPRHKNIYNIHIENQDAMLQRLESAPLVPTVKKREKVRVTTVRNELYSCCKNSFM